MAVIHMETEAAYDCLNRFKQGTADLEERDQFFSQTIATLDIHWQSPAQQEFLQDLGQLRQQIRTTLEQMTRLGAALEKEINQWIEMDRDGLGGSAAGGTGTGRGFGIEGHLNPIQTETYGKLVRSNRVIVNGKYYVYYEMKYSNRVVSGFYPLSFPYTIPNYIDLWLHTLNTQKFYNTPVTPDSSSSRK